MTVRCWRYVEPGMGRGASKLDRRRNGVVNSRYAVAATLLVVLLASGCSQDSPATTVAPASSNTNPDGATTSTTTAATVESTVSHTSGTVLTEPPGLQLIAGSAEVTLRGFDYCWEGAGCADSFGTEVPQPVDVDLPSITVRWIEEGTVTASIRDDADECPRFVPLAPVGAGEWTMAMPADPGTYRVYFSGQAGESSSVFAAAISSSVPGEEALPVAAVWLPDVADELLAEVELYSTEPASSATLTIDTADGASVTISLEDGTLDGAYCGPQFFGSVDPVAGTANLGETPYSVTMTVQSGSTQYTRSWVWPDQLDSEGRLSGALQPTVEE
jgi:hypothetical protein